MTFSRLRDSIVPVLTSTYHRVAETLPEEVLTKMKAPPKPDYPIVNPTTLLNHDAFLMGVPTRYGNMPAQWKAFWDSTGQVWATGGYVGKYVGVFVSSGSSGGGQESTAIACMSTIAHHGLIYVPLGYGTAFPILTNLSEARGGSPWGAGTFVSTSLPTHCHGALAYVVVRLAMEPAHLHHLNLS